MACPHCRSSAISQRRHCTEIGYRRFRCRSCGRRFNDRPPPRLPARGPTDPFLGRKVLHRTDRYLSNLTEQSHRAVKQRYYPMLGFGNFESAARWDDDRRGLRRCAAAADATA